MSELTERDELAKDIMMSLALGPGWHKKLLQNGEGVAPLVVVFGNDSVDTLVERVGWHEGAPKNVFVRLSDGTVKLLQVVEMDDYELRERPDGS